MGWLPRREEVLQAISQDSEVLSLAAAQKGFWHNGHPWCPAVWANRDAVLQALSKGLTRLHQVPPQFRAELRLGSWHGQGGEREVVLAELFGTREWYIDWW